MKNNFNPSFDSLDGRITPGPILSGGIEDSMMTAMSLYNYGQVQVQIQNPFSTTDQFFKQYYQDRLIHDDVNHTFDGFTNPYIPFRNKIDAYIYHDDGTDILGRPR